VTRLAPQLLAAFRTNILPHCLEGCLPPETWDAALARGWTDGQLTAACEVFGVTRGAVAVVTETPGSGRGIVRRYVIPGQLLPPRGAYPGDAVDEHGEDARRARGRR